MLDGRPLEQRVISDEELMRLFADLQPSAPGLARALREMREDSTFESYTPYESDPPAPHRVPLYWFHDRIARHSVRAPSITWAVYEQSSSPLRLVMLRTSGSAFACGLDEQSKPVAWYLIDLRT